MQGKVPYLEPRSLGVASLKSAVSDHRASSSPALGTTNTGGNPKLELPFLPLSQPPFPPVLITTQSLWAGSFTLDQVAFHLRP